MKLPNCTWFLLVLLAAAAPAAPVRRLGAAEPSNLCYNGSFDSTNAPLDGWTTDYTWQGNSHYMGNHTRISQQPEHAGHKRVLHMAVSAETKVESRAIPIELGSRYRCELELAGNVDPHIYFTGYKWEPGVHPYANPHLGDLRRIYKSEFRNHKVSGLSGGWRRVSFEFPLENLSELAMKSLKEVRFVTVFIIAVDGSAGDLFVDNVKVTKLSAPPAAPARKTTRKESSR